jgi:hypothetical protein
MCAGTACALSKPEWEHVVFDKIYNRQVTDKKRITAWMNWKVPRVPLSRWLFAAFYDRRRGGGHAAGTGSG